MQVPRCFRYLLSTEPVPAEWYGHVLNKCSYRAFAAISRCWMKAWEWTEPERQPGRRRTAPGGQRPGEGKGAVTSRSRWAEGLCESGVSDSLQERSSSSSCSTEELWETDLSVHRGHSGGQFPPKAGPRWAVLTQTSRDAGTRKKLKEKPESWGDARKGLWPRVGSATPGSPLAPWVPC